MASVLSMFSPYNTCWCLLALGIQNTDTWNTIVEHKVCTRQQEKLWNMLTIFEGLNSARLIWSHYTIVIHCTEITCVCCVRSKTTILHTGLVLYGRPIHWWATVCLAGVRLVGVCLAGEQVVSRCGTRLTSLRTPSEGNTPGTSHYSHKATWCSRH